jgi:hypothetical protein
MTKNRRLQFNWKREVISALRAEMRASEEFFAFVETLTPSQMRLIREAFESVAETAYAEGAGHDFRR